MLYEYYWVISEGATPYEKYHGHPLCQFSYLATVVSYAEVGKASCSPISSELKSSWSFICQEAAVLFTSCSFKVSYGVSAGGQNIMSRISVANAGEREATIWSNLVLCKIFPHAVICTLTWANHTWVLAPKWGNLDTDCSYCSDKSVELSEYYNGVFAPKYL